MFELIISQSLFSGIFDFGLNLQTITVLILLLSVTFFQLYDLRSEYFSPIFMKEIGPDYYDYHIHHDEKQIVPDARYLFLKGKRDIAITDFATYPISGAFGIAGPSLAYFGFRLFGLNNTGLRFFYILITTFSNLFSVLCLLKVFPGLQGSIFCILFILNYHSFILNRHAIIEHVLTFLLTGMFFFYLVNPACFLHNIHLIGFFAGISILAKPNFVIYTYILLMSIAFVEKIGFPAIWRVFLCSMGGLGFFETIQMIVLCKLGIARERYATVLRGVKQVAGAGKWVALQGRLKPIGVKVFWRYFSNFTEWYGIPIHHLKFLHKWILLIVGLIIFFLLCVFVFDLHLSFPRSGWVLITFLGVCLISMSPFYYYLKRGFPIFPSTIILFALVFHTAVDRLVTVFPAAEIGVVILLSVCVIIYITSQLLIIYRLPVLNSQGVEECSAQLDNDLPESSVIYTHCLGYRFFWQTRKHRLMSGDDTIWSNQMIVDRAIRDKAKYVLLSHRVGPIEFAKIKHLKLFKTYKTIPNESDVPERFFLYELINDKYPETEIQNVKECSFSLGNNLPDSSIIYTHFLGYKYFRMIKNQKLASGYNKTMANKRAFESALHENGNYVLLFDGDGPITPEMTRYLSLINIYNYSEIGHDTIKTFFLFNVSSFKDLPFVKPKWIAGNSASLNHVIPYGSRVYTNYLCYPFFKKVKKEKLKTVDGLGCNQELIDWALENRVKYVMLSLKGGDIELQTIRNLRLIKVYKYIVPIFNVYEKFYLYELIYEIPLIASNSMKGIYKLLCDDVPEYSTIYMYYNGYNFFCMLKNCKLKAGYRRVNQEGISNAKKNSVKYVLLHDSGGPVEPESIGELHFIKEYKVIDDGDDTPETFSLYELIA